MLRDRLFHSFFYLSLSSSVVALVSVCSIPFPHPLLSFLFSYLYTHTQQLMETASSISEPDADDADESILPQRVVANTRSKVAPIFTPPTATAPEG
jgi:hypothetical protein